MWYEKKLKPVRLLGYAGMWPCWGGFRWVLFSLDREETAGREEEGYFVLVDTPTLSRYNRKKRQTLVSPLSLEEACWTAWSSSADTPSKNQSIEITSLLISLATVTNCHKLADYSLLVLEARGLKSRYQQSCTPSKDLREEPFLASSRFGSSGRSLVCGSSFCLHLHITFSFSPCLYRVSFQRITCWI